MEPSSSREITILNRSGRRSPAAVIRRALEATLQLHKKSGTVSVLLTGDEEMRELNRSYRGIDNSTDVLTFPAGDFPGAPLGDIAISVPYAERQARARGVSLSQEIGFLSIHGGLHLLGFEDDSEDDRARMVGEMNRVAVAAGLKPDEEWWSVLHGGDA